MLRLLEDLVAKVDFALHHSLEYVTKKPQLEAVLKVTKYIAKVAIKSINAMIKANEIAINKTWSPSVLLAHQAP